MDQCQICPPGNYSLDVAKFYRSDSEIDLTFKALNSQNPPCLGCPKGAICTLGSVLTMEKNYWRGTDVSCEMQGNNKPGKCRNFETARRTPSATFSRRVARVYRCPPKFCLASNVTGTFQCRPGHTGVACGVCMEGWAMNGATCAICDNEEESAEQQRGRMVARFAAPVIAGLVLVVIWYIFAWRPLFASEGAGGGLEAKLMSCIMVLIAFPVVRHMRKVLSHMSGKGGQGSGHIQMVFKIIVGFFQVLGSFIGTFEIEWPNVFEQLMGLTNFLQFNFIQMPGTHCILAKTSYFDKLRGQTLFPLFCITLLLIPTLWCTVSGMLFFGGPRNHPKRDAVVTRLYQSVMLLLFLVYPSVSTSILRSFNCKDYGIFSHFEFGSCADETAS